MSPINWLVLFLFFLMMFYMMMNFLYFNFNKTPKTNNSKTMMMKNYNKSI
uniref:ATP synthase subunit 8 n=1 Tax=Chaitophorus saliniger TaxID=179831 RepID=A0A1L1YMJ8_9HEMI|nr:ATP synthase subunit 8 [Chaitophorus saliniger]